jgi:voltage-gated potassium channel
MGRVVAVALMIGGITLVGTVTATLASWIVQRVAEDTASEAATGADRGAPRRSGDSRTWSPMIASPPMVKPEGI